MRKVRIQNDVRGSRSVTVVRREPSPSEAADTAVLERLRAIEREIQEIKRVLLHPGETI